MIFATFNEWLRSAVAGVRLIYYHEQRELIAIQAGVQWKQWNKAILAKIVGI